MGDLGADPPGLALGLERGAGSVVANDALAAAAGGRVGLDGVLADLNRVAEPAFAPGRLTSWAFGWDREDDRSSRWWPQGITTSADASPDEQYDGRDVVVTTAYSKNLGGIHKGARITVVDVTDPGRIRYRHVLLVAASLDDAGGLELHPVRAHAGGVVWSGPLLHVAATARGLLSFRLDDLVRVTSREQNRLGRLPDGSLAGFGHRYLLPLQHVHAARTLEGVEPFRYSFVSLARADGATSLLAGEYGHGAMTTRLLSYPLDPGTHLPATGADGAASGRLLEHGGVQHMQGVVPARGRLYVTSSRGPHRLGSLFVGQPGHFRELRDALPVGPEDVCHWPSRHQLWSLSEYPRGRLVFAVDLARVDPQR